MENSSLAGIFVGPNGIRAGWRLLLVFIAAAALIFWRYPDRRRVVESMQSMRSPMG
jgi:hypothetical protein